MRGDAHEGRRVVLPNEQHTHSFLEAGPFMAVSFTSCLYWEQFFALLGLGNERPRFELRPRQKPLSRNYIIGILTAIALTVALPYAEEFWRCYRADKTIAPLPETRVPGVFAGEEHSSQAWRLSYHKKRVSDMACHEKVAGTCHAERQRRIRGGPRRPVGETRCFAAAQHDTPEGLFHSMPCP